MKKVISLVLAVILVSSVVASLFGCSDEDSDDADDDHYNEALGLIEVGYKDSQMSLA